MSGLGRSDFRRDGLFLLRLEVAVVVAHDVDPRILRGNALRRLPQHIVGGAQTEHAVAMSRAALEHPVHEVDAGDALGQRSAQKPARPHDGDAVGQNDVAGQDVVLQDPVTAHIHDLGSIHDADLQMPPVHNRVVYQVEYFGKRRGGDGDAK